LENKRKAASKKAICFLKYTIVKYFLVNLIFLSDSYTYLQIILTTRLYYDL